MLPSGWSQSSSCSHPRPPAPAPHPVTGTPRHSQSHRIRAGPEGWTRAIRDRRAPGRSKSATPNTRGLKEGPQGQVWDQAAGLHSGEQEAAWGTRALNLHLSTVGLQGVGRPGATSSEQVALGGGAVEASGGSPISPGWVPACKGVGWSWHGTLRATHTGGDQPLARLCKSKLINTCQTNPVSDSFSEDPSHLAAGPGCKHTSGMRASSLEER